MDSLAPEPLLNIRDVTLEYRRADTVVTAVEAVSFDVYPSDRCVLLGPSGCGKSTLLSAVGGYIKPAFGEIRFKGKRISRPGPDRIMVFQEFDQLLPWKTVRENVLFPLRCTGRRRGREADDIADSYIEKVGLSRFTHAYPHTLSGGMKQRVALARGMAMEPDMLLMDEPFAALDALTRQRMQDELQLLWRDTKFAVLFVTHSVSEAIRIGNRILLMTPHPGRLKAELPSNGEDSVDATGLRLSQRIHESLFGAGAYVEEAEHV